MENCCGDCLAGLDDGFFQKTWKKTLLGLAIHCQAPGGILVPLDVFLEPVTVDGMDATQRAVVLVKRALRAGYPLRAVFTDTVVFAGFNILDPEALYRETMVPVITVNLYPHDEERIKRALVKHFPDHEERLRLLRSNWAKQRRVSCRKGSIIIASYGLGFPEAWATACQAQVYSREPEPLYTAGLLASTATRLLGSQSPPPFTRSPHLK